MDGAKVFELKVGIFILIGIAILFVIVFSVGDINLAKTGYHIKVIFNFAAGSEPVFFKTADVAGKGSDL